MKAKEYIEKYKDLIMCFGKIPNNEPEAEFARRMLTDLSLELKDITKSRNIVKMQSLISVVVELNNKWKSVNGGIKKMLGTSVFKEDMFTNYISKTIPDLTPYLEHAGVV